MKAQQYKIEVSPLAPSDGGGFLATVPELPGCKSDGDAREEALANARDAIECWLEAARELGRAIPAPKTAYA